MKTTSSTEYEAVFAAAAHTLTAGRHYDDEALVLKACARLTGPGDPPASMVDKLNVVRGLCAQLFSGYRNYGIGDVPAPTLTTLRAALEKLDKTYLKQLKASGKPIKTKYDYIEAVIKRPPMYLGRTSMELLHISLCEQPWIRAKVYIEEKPHFSGFPAWVDRRFPHLQGGGHGWWTILVKAAGGDDVKAFKLFAKELKAFRKM